MTKSNLASTTVGGVGAVAVFVQMYATMSFNMLACHVSATNDDDEDVWLLLMLLGW